MNMDETIDSFRQLYPRHGRFTLAPGGSIKKAVSEHTVPDGAGVYVIRALSPNPKSVYVGKAGTLKQNGNWSGQKLVGRLANKQNRVPRERFFPQYIDQHSLEGLMFEWFVTFDANVKTLPALAEAQLLQVYFTENGHLPELNKEI